MTGVEISAQEVLLVDVENRFRRDYADYKKRHKNVLGSVILFTIVSSLTAAFTVIEINENGIKLLAITYACITVLVVLLIVGILVVDEQGRTRMRTSAVAYVRQLIFKSTGKLEHVECKRDDVARINMGLFYAFFELETWLFTLKFNTGEQMSFSTYEALCAEVQEHTSAKTACF